MNPVPVSNWLFKVFPATSLTPDVTLILYVVEEDKLEYGVTVNVLSELDIVGEEGICTQVLKLSEETLKVPEQEVFEVLVVTDVVSIISEKFTEMDEVTNTDVSESAGEIEETVGAVVSSLKA